MSNEQNQFEYNSLGKRFLNNLGVELVFA